MTVLDTAPCPVRIEIQGPNMVATFDRFDLDAYQVFIKAKRIPETQVAYDWRTDAYTVTAPARFAALLGIQGAATDGELLPLAEHLFDYQAWIVRMALDARRFAVWADTGLGKTPMYLEWARQVVALTGGRVAILAPLQVIGQVREMAAEFYGADLPIDHLQTREALAAWCVEPGMAIGITNYEKFIPGTLPELRHLAGLVADESSVLKTGGGVIKWNLIKSARGIDYKLSCTATPAPNDTMEYASQAAFLEKIRAEGDVLWTYFTRDKSGNWRVKPHARQAFYQFMATWSVYVRNPAHFGFRDILATLPDPDIREYELPISSVQRELMYAYTIEKSGGLFSDDRMGVVERTKLSQLAKGFLYDGKGKDRTAARIESAKPDFVADLVREDVLDGRQVLVWTVFDEESEILAEAMCGHAGIGILDGSMSMERRIEIVQQFKAGDLAVLISKAQLIGYGMNFQNCRSMVFSGFDDSFERMYQAIRRAYRYGQTETVRVHVPYIPELEGMMFSNVKRKQAQFDSDTEIQENHYRLALASLLEGAV